MVRACGACSACLLHPCCMPVACVRRHARYEEPCVLRSKHIQGDAVPHSPSCHVSWGHTACVCLCGGEEGCEGGRDIMEVGCCITCNTLFVSIRVSTYIATGVGAETGAREETVPQLDTATTTTRQLTHTTLPQLDTTAATPPTAPQLQQLQHRSYSSYSTAATARQLTHTSSPLHC